jgi:hypothetical protein
VSKLYTAAFQKKKKNQVQCSKASLPDEKFQKAVGLKITR